jgi:hypothetical protein
LNTAFLIHFAASGAAVAALVGLAAWARIARPLPPLDEVRARALFAEEFPGRAVEQVWTAADGSGAIGKSGAAALVLVKVGDGYAARQIAWTEALAADCRDGLIRLNLSDAGAPKAAMAISEWPPKGLAA